MRSNRLRMKFWRPAREGEALAEPGAALLLSYLEGLEAVEPSFARVGFDNGDPAEARRPELWELARELRTQGMVVGLYDGDEARAGRRVEFAGGWRMAPTKASLGAKGELWRRTETVHRLLEHGIGHWEAHEAGVYFVERGHRFWLRWQRDGAETMLPDVPLGPGHASERAWLGGRLWEWPEHAPGRILDGAD